MNRGRMPFPVNFRLYDVEGMKLPSVTTILHNFIPDDAGLKRWKANTPDWREQFEFKGKVGTLVHNRISEYFIDKFGVEGEAQTVDFDITTDIELEARMCMSHFEEFVRKFNPIPKAVEVRVWHRVMKYAGTMDWVGQINDMDVIVDWKTSARIYPSHTYQISAYRQAYESDPEVKKKMDACVLIILNVRNGLTVGKVIDEDKAWKEYLGAFDEFQKVYRNPEDQIDIKELEGKS